MGKKREDQPEPVEKLTRQQACQRVVKEFLAKGVDGTIEDLADEADSLFLRGNPKTVPDPERCFDIIQTQFETLDNLGLVSLRWSCAVRIINGKNGGKSNGH